VTGSNGGSRKRIVIVGNSAAGISALEAVRSVDRECAITLVSDEDVPAYSRVMTPYLVSGERDDIFIRDRSYYGRMGVETVFGRRAVELEERKLVLDDGTALAFDRLLLATGSHAAVPGNLSLAPEGVFALKNLPDAEGIRRRAEESERGARTARGARALMIGGGLVCLLVVRALMKRGLDLTIAVTSDRILSRMLDEEGSRIVADRLGRRGVAIRTGVDIVEIRDGEGEGGAAHGGGNSSGTLTAVSAEGEEFPAELMIIAKGIRSNVEPAKSAGIETSRGILVDPYMRTSMENVYAAGDVAESKDLLIRGKRTICATWFEAVYQGELAGYNMAGIKRPTKGSLKMNVMETADLPIASIGVYDGPEVERVVVRRSDGAAGRIGPNGDGLYRKIAVRKDKVIGAVLVGDVSDAGVLTQMIRRGLKLSELDRVNLRRRVVYPSLMRL